MPYNGSRNNQYIFKKATVSLISSQSEILKKDVYLIEFIHKDIKESLQHMKALYIIRSTESNFKIL